jgi:hypothetical protein
MAVGLNVARAMTMRTRVSTMRVYFFVFFDRFLFFHLTYVKLQFSPTIFLF